MTGPSYTLVGHIGRPAEPGVPVLISQEWLSEVRALLATHEAGPWQGLDDGTKSRTFVPRRMRLAKHFLNAYDRAVALGDAPLVNNTGRQLQRLLSPRHPRWGAVL